MPIGRSIITGKPIPSASGVTLMARLRIGSALVTQASLASIGYTVTDTTTGTVLGAGLFPIATSVSDSLVVGDPRWTQDTPAQPSQVDQSSGYNFLAVLPATLFPIRAPAAPDLLAGAVPGHQYQCAVVFTPVFGQPFRVLWAWSEAVSYG